MLQIQNIKKKYQIGDYVQLALNDVSLNLRDNEFVAILGPSGSGKTTLLNIIGGLDRYDDGDLIINNISTKKYKDKDWDSYRNHTIGFVFQSYNLISHQSVLTNVELALTISGISKSQRKKMAIEALKKVGLEDHIHKKPNQMSGGQMQRVAIARALVNNPDILLADEPTGALDSDTSVQIMDLLKEVAKDRLVVMVTHNPELAEEYATRIVRLRDGKITDDNDQFVPEKTQVVAEHKNMGKASMSFLTSLSLSFNNLKTKKGRTILTSFAGSIGIIGIALILALSSGVNTYIADIQKETMSSYPITIDAQTFDMESMMEQGGPNGAHREQIPEDQLTAIYPDNSFLEIQESITSSIVENDLTKFKEYLDDPNSEIQQYLGENGIVYGYDVKFDVYVKDSDGNVIDTNDDPEEETVKPDAQMQMMASMMGMSDTSNAQNFGVLMAGADGEEVSQIVTDSYNMLKGSWPDEYDEVMLILDSNNSIPTSVLYQLGMITKGEYNDIKKQIEDGEEVNPLSWTYDEMIGHEFNLVAHCDYYEENDNDTFSFVELDDDAIIEKSIKLKVVGVAKAKEDAQNATIVKNVAYSPKLTNYIIDYTDKSAVVLAQEKDENVNILTGVGFEALDDTAKANNAKDYLSNMSVSEKASLYTMMMSSAPATTPTQPTTPPEAVDPTADPSAQMPPMQAPQPTTEEEMAAGLDYWLENVADEETLLGIYDDYLGEASYNDNLSDFGKVSYDAPSSISIYADSFEDKDGVSASIENYNSTVESDEEITYTDFVALLTSSLTSIINVISYVLIAFVSVSLIVSCIMIGIITHISVLERTKEIGILRAIGASKKNISQVFNAETLIIGFCAGTIGVVISALFTIPINAVVHLLTDNDSINANLPIIAAVVLVLISVIITVIAGFLPAKKAAKKDPVIALRSE